MRKQINMTKSLSIAEAMMFNGFFMGIQGFVLTAIALYFKATPLILALISTLPVIAQMMQIFTLKVYKVLKTRKRILIIMAMISRLSFIILPIAVLFNFTSSYVLLAVVAVYSFFGTFVGNVWIAAMGEIIGEKERGKFFGLRNLFAALATMFFLYFYGYVLQNFEGKTSILIITVIMAIAALATIILLDKHYVPDLEETKKSFGNIMLPLKNKNFKKFLFFVVYWVFSVELVKPFFSYYQIQVLNVDKEFLGILGVVTGVISMLLYIGIGKLTDHFGNKIILSGGMIISTYNILLYMMMDASNYKMLLIMDSVFNAFAWSAINLAFFNLLLEVAEKPTEAYSGLYALVFGGTGLATAFIGGTLGNVLQDKTFVIMGESYHGIKLIFIIGFVIRIFAILHLTNVDAYLKNLRYSGMMSVTYVVSKRMNINIQNIVKNFRKN